MSARAARAESLLRKIGNELQLSEQGKLYLENAIDPFPDSRRQLTGYPDAGVGASVCPKVKASITIPCPASITTGTWDLHIFNAPMVYSSGFGVAGGVLALTRNNGPGYTTGAFSSGSPIGGPFCGLVCCTIATGTDLNMLTGNYVSIFCLTLPTTYQSDPFRVISSAFEVHNPSASLTRQGTITCYRQPQNTAKYSTVATIFNNAGVGIVGYLSIVPEALPPANTSKALSLADSVQWEAEKGCYIVHGLHTMDLPMDAYNMTQPLFYNGAVTDSTCGVPALANTTVGTGSGVYLPQLHAWTEFDMGGCILSGLDIKNTILVNYNFQIEVFPTANSPYVLLADPSPPADERALAIVSHLHRELPVAVTVDRNGFGDWLSAAVNTVKDAVSPSLKMISSALLKVPHPKSQLLGMGVSMLHGGKTKKAGKNHMETELEETKRATKNVKKLLAKEAHSPPSAGPSGK